MSTYLITGGAGFIGSNLAEELLARGETVRVLDNFATGRRENLAGLDVELVEADIRDLAAIQPAFAEVDYVLHQAALRSVPRSVEDPASTNAVNVDGTLNVLLAAREAGVQRVVFASSSSVYGGAPSLPRRESDRPLPLSPYAASKLAGEAYCAAFTHVYGVETVSLRYFNVFGPRQDPASEYAAVIPLFVDALRAGRQPVIFGDGETSRDFCYVSNVVEANLLAAQAAGAASGVFNVACGERYTLNQLVALLNEILGTDLAPQYEPERVGDMRHSLADLAAARAVLGYEPRVVFRQGLERAVEWYRSAGD
jgi:UDP-glucose 4-epimerase